MLLFDATHTSHTQAHTGVQRVTRSLFAALQAAREGTEPVCYDHFLGAWRALDANEREALRPPAGPVGTRRGSHWPWPTRLAGRARRFLGKIPPTLSGDALLCPEIFSPVVARNLPVLLARVPGPRVALFHDAIALKFPELTPGKTVARFPAYLQELRLFDGVAAISEASAASLRDYWTWLGLHDTPPVATLPLGLDLPPTPAAGPGAGAAGGVPVVLCVGSIEGRKNHVSLLEACEALWREGLRFELHLIGLAQPATGAAALAKLRELQAAGRPVRYDGPQPEAALHAAYAACAFTVYPSLVEGFGLPVIESLAHGKPCICSGRGALGESARGGGCLPLDTVDADSLEAAMRWLLDDPAELTALAAAAGARTFRNWHDYQAGLLGWMRTLPRRGDDRSTRP